jgi:hypothetical protein
VRGLARALAAQALTAAVSACGPEAETRSSEPRWEAPRDAGAAYASLLNELGATLGRLYPEQAAATFVIQREPLPVYRGHVDLEAPELWKRLRRHLPSLRRETYDDWWARNQHAALHDFGDEAGERAIVWIDSAELDRLLPETLSGEARWKPYLARFPDSHLVGCTAMGFSRDGLQGLVYLSFLGWYGGYYVVVKQAGDWRLADEWEVWVS